MRDTHGSRELPYGIQPPGYRLPDDAHVGLVRLLVSDLPRSLEYYEHVIGLRPIRVGRDSAALGSRDGRVLVELQTRSGVTQARRGAFGLFHFAILLPDRAALGHFAAHTVSRGIRVGMADHLVSESIYLWDPDDLGIEVYADRPRRTWQRNGREVAMATDPLDLAKVIADGGGGVWEGAPSGSTIGHMHLHVGSLEEAEAFYHRAIGFDKTVWNYPGALFMSAGGYHHHLGTNVWSPGPRPGADQAQLLEWELVVPSITDVTAVAESLRREGYQSKHLADGLLAADPWLTTMRIRAAKQ